jgi:peptidoglycan/LPS O-acetylase OafA/YrhL
MYLGFLLSRYLHVVCATLLVGGTLFYEMVVPAAIEELKPEQQSFIFARARWFFRSIVWLSAAILLISGTITTFQHWNDYTGTAYLTSIPAANQPHGSMQVVAPKTGWWWAAHLGAGGITILVALFLTFGNRPPERPVQWMRFNLVLLLIVMFLGTAARHVRLSELERLKTMDQHKSTPITSDLLPHPINADESG